MAIVTDFLSTNAVIKINVGTAADGKISTKSINLTGLKKESFTDEDKQKLINIKDALTPLLNHSFYNIEMSQRTEIYEN